MAATWQQRAISLTIAILWLLSKTSGGAGNGVQSTQMPRGDEHRVVVRYGIDGSAGGVINQMLCHIGAFMLAVSLRAEIELPNALSRSTYNVSFWQQKWHVEPLSTLLDVDRIVVYWQRQGIAVHKVSPQQGPQLPVKASALQAAACACAVIVLKRHGTLVQCTIKACASPLSKGCRYLL